MPIEQQFFGPQSQPKHTITAPRQQAFTLIELLVVVAIIALLISILLPSLNRARRQAKLVICQTNMKQIGNMIPLYQNDHNGFLPVIFNYFSYAHGQWDAPARVCWVSVALRDYHGDLAGLENIENGRFDPDTPWYPETGNLEYYENNILPDFFVCPFARGDGDGRKVVDNSDRFFRLHEWEGRHEHYQTFMWEITREQPPSGRFWPGGPGDDFRGFPKYSTATWSTAQLTGSGLQPNNPLVQNKHKFWRASDASRLKSAALSDLTAIFCAQGEHNLLALGPKWDRVNVGSHSRGQRGGTNVLFADFHVEWVEGTRIGWP